MPIVPKQIEQVIDYRSSRAFLPLLKQLETGYAILIQRHDLTIQDGVKLSRLKLDNKIYLSVPGEWEKKLNFLKEKKGNSCYIRLNEIDNLEK